MSAKEPSSFGVFGAAALKNGYPAFPIPWASKSANIRGWQRWCSNLPTDVETARWLTTRSSSNTAIACGKFLFAIDIDELDPVMSAHVRDLVVGALGQSTILTRIGRAPKQLLVYSVDGPLVRTTHFGGTDLLGDGAYFVAAGEHPDTHRPYQWLTDSPATTPIWSLPPVTSEALDRLHKALTNFYRPGTKTSAPPKIIKPKSAPRFDLKPFDQGPVTYDGSGRVVDGRDIHLMRLVRQEAIPGRDAKTIGSLAWDEFQKTADLARPRRDGMPWTRRHALVKAAYLLRPDRRKHLRRGETTKHGFWTHATKRAFAAVVTDLGSKGKLSPAAVKVSHCMLSFIYGDGYCFASVATIAATVDLSPNTVKEVRRKLIRAGLWTTQRLHITDSARYRPEPRALDFEIGLQAIKVGGV